MNLECPFIEQSVCQCTSDQEHDGSSIQTPLDAPHSSSTFSHTRVAGACLPDLAGDRMQKRKKHISTQAYRLHLYLLPSIHSLYHTFHYNFHPLNPEHLSEKEPISGLFPFHIK